MERKSFKFHTEWKEALSDCPAEVRLEVYEAIIEYATSGTLIELKPLAKIAFVFIKKMMDEDFEKESELRRKRSEGGKKGMSRRYNSVADKSNTSNSVNSVITQSNSLNSLSQERPLKENPPTPPKEYIPKESEVKNNISSSRTREEIELERFDALLQEVVDGKHQIWVDEMYMKHRIENVIDLLPSFRSHVIANAKVNSVTDINGFKGYFNRAFRFFTKINPIELLTQYEESAKSEKFKKFCEWISKSAPNVAHGLVPMSEDEFENIFSLYDSGKVFNTIRDLNEREDLIAKYFSLYRTLLKWMKNDNT